MHCAVGIWALSCHELEENGHEVFDLAHVLVTGKDSVRLSCPGMLDLVRPEGRPLPQLQQEDMQSLGRLLVNLACSNVNAASSQQALQKSMGFLQASFSSVSGSLSSLVGYPPCSRPTQKAMKVQVLKLKTRKLCVLMLFYFFRSLSWN